MYEQFKSEVLAKLAYMSGDDLRRIGEAMDLVSQKYRVKKQETSIAVLGREEFNEIAYCYIVTKKSEGIADSTLKQVTIALRNFINSMTKPISKITPNDIRAYLFTYQRSRSVSNRTLDYHRTMICTFFKWCAAEGYIDKDPTVNIKPIKYVRKPRKALNQLQLERVRRACKTPRELCIVEILYSTGCRVSELCNIRIQDVDWANHEITVLGKGSKYRRVFINAKAEIAIEAYLTARKHKSSEWLVCNDRGGGKMTKANIEKIFSRIEKETGIFVTPHIMRHTMATQALTGTSVEVVQQMLGHVNIATTMIYAEVNQDSVHAAHLRCVI